ncbi:hypothetical protein HMPREF9370_2146 [Neisseria wadsworthii 9715]|uniref:Uncharacterized protein n=1 Tax=Neisseria wadsworthii 9715 TaxID=1030841 RepID=G4CSR4_9NEIS|nr:hypothetical protein HMPREF9370_2146 [Neisseria wadsworthii 9715]
MLRQFVVNQPKLFATWLLQIMGCALLYRLINKERNNVIGKYDQTFK